MHPSSASAVRLLAAWQQQRRALTDRVDTLLLHGPTAVDRVAARAEELRAALDAERAAFEAFVAGAARTGAAPVPDGGDRARPDLAPVDHARTDRDADRPDGRSPCIDLLRPGLVAAGLVPAGLVTADVDPPLVDGTDDTPDGTADDGVSAVLYPRLRAVTDAGV